MTLATLADFFGNSNSLVGDNVLYGILVALDEGVFLPLGADTELEPAGDPDGFPSLAIFEGAWTPIEAEPGLIRWNVDITVEGYVERGDGGEASGARNLLHAAVFGAIMADQTLRGAAELITPGGRRNSTAYLSEKRRLSFQQDFAVQFTTLRDNPALPG
jgi:hypothetical protein